MRYYSKIIFRLFVIIHLLTLPVVLFLGVNSFFWIIGFLATGDYESLISQGLFIVGPILFVIFSGIILLLQQFKNKYWGYMMLFLVPVSLYIITYVLRYTTWLEIKSFLFQGIQTIIFMTPIFFMLLTPFYVLMKLVKDDLFKKQGIAKC